MSKEEGQEAALPEKREAEDKKDVRRDVPIEPEVLEKLPPEVKKVVESFSLFSGSVPVFNPIYKKINESHIDKILDQADKDSQRDYDEGVSTRKYSLVYTVIVLIFLAGMTVFLVNTDRELYKEVLKLILPFLAGMAGGYGLKAYQDRDKE
ncbi:MAG TPA: hypothetical protein VGB17_16475 [Pyrinomonadaceae bacterium]|jgi:hypothetical protein